MSYKEFKQKYLINNFTDRKGNPKHTRLVKHLFYKFSDELKKEYNFDIFTCLHCNCSKHNNLPVIMELDHINRKTNDSRIENLRPLCPNCHQQTLGYKNRKISIEEYYNKLKHKK